jgi:hypothetical protein
VDLSVGQQSGSLHQFDPFLALMLSHRDATEPSNSGSFPVLFKDIEKGILITGGAGKFGGHVTKLLRSSRDRRRRRKFAVTRVNT